MDKCQICGSKHEIVVIDSGAVCWECLRKGFKEYIRQKSNLELHELEEDEKLKRLINEEEGEIQLCFHCENLVTCYCKCCAVPLCDVHASSSSDDGEYLCPDCQKEQSHWRWIKDG